MVHCKIQLKTLHYYPGTLLTGTVGLYLDEPRLFRAFYVHFYGDAKCNWTESGVEVTSGRGRNRRFESITTDYSGKKVYLNTKLCLFGDEGARPFEVPKGVHHYEFSCQLPVNLPESFEASCGRIQYKVEAVLDVPWEVKESFEVPFTVIREVDLNLYPELAIPCQSEEIKEFCCLLCQYRTLSVKVTIPHSGFATGKTINVAINYENNSNVEVTGTSIYLLRVVKYQSQNPEIKNKYESTIVVRFETGGVKASSSKKIDKELKLPEALVHSNGSFCKIVEVFYLLGLEAETSGWNDNIVTNIPITIGSVPLRVGTVQSLAAPTEIPHIQLPTAPEEVSDEFVDLPPPSFEEVMKMDKTGKVLKHKKSQRNIGWTVAAVEYVPLTKRNGTT